MFLFSGEGFGEPAEAFCRLLDTAFPRRVYELASYVDCEVAGTLRAGVLLIRSMDSMSLVCSWLLSFDLAGAPGFDR